MTLPRCFMVAMLTLVLAGCFQGSPPAADLDRFSSAGHATGKMDGDATYVGAMEWQHGDQLRYFLLSQLPGEDPAPAALLLVRGIAANQSQSSGSQGGNETKLFWRHQLTGSNSKTYDISYEITYRPAAAELMLGGQTVDLDFGRVIQIDLTQNPVKPVQVKTSIYPLFPSHEPSADEFKHAIDALAITQESVRRFLEGAK